ncbi:hypothetical protein [Deinococcus sp.]|uniref:hypothetical protein n=1 Tax=Deinococcus sp. TaxID=47478 RepID=UPI003CC6079A
MMSPRYARPSGLLHWLTALAALLAIFGTAAQARPFRGSVAWSVLLCRFSDSAAPHHDLAYYRDLFFNAGTGGGADYWNDVSYGSLNFNGSVVQGWFTEGVTEAQARAQSRDDKINGCVNAARGGGYNVPAGNHLAVVTDTDIDLFGWNGGSFLPWQTDIGAFGHEGGHGLGLNHSFSDDPTYRNIDWAQIGEYDDNWDVMSYANVFGTNTARFGFGGPGLNGFHADRMGWLSRSRILTFGADGRSSATVTLTALSHPEAGGVMLVRLPFDPGDPFHYYTVEYRRNDHWDAGFPAPIVLIHEIKNIGDTSYSFLLRNRGGDRAPVQSLNANGIQISVNGVSGNTATVTISSSYPDRCLQGYVWREATASDHVCVTPQVRQQARDDNAQAASRRQPGGGPYGPNTCRQGFVWREAVGGDQVCVTPQTRQAARDDNAQAGNRNNPARFVYGPNTCKQGYVWREADDRDWVCVSPQVRQQTRDDNAQAAARRQPGGGPYGPDTCRQGFVWREAYPGDHVCVVPQTRQGARDDNAQAQNRLAHL